MKIALVSTLLFLSGYLTAQVDKPKHYMNDISLSGGVGLAERSFGRYGIMYRKSLNESWKWKLSGDYDRTISTNQLINEPFFSSDSLIILRKYGISSQSYSMKTGFDKNLFSIFVVGADINLGNETRNNITIDKGLKYDADAQEWQDCIDCVYEYHNLDPLNPYNISAHDVSQSTQFVKESKGGSYFVFGLSLNMGVQYPLSNRWALALQYSPELLRYQSLNKEISSSKFRHYADLLLWFAI